MTRHLALLATVARNPRLLRVEGGFLLFSMGEWASWLAIVVYAFGRGGPAEAGIIGFAVSAPSILVAPTAALLGDRWPRARVLFGSYVVQAIAMAAAAVALAADVAPLAYASAITSSTLISLGRPALSALLPELVRSPDELAAANVATGIAEGGGALGGPLVAGVLLAVGGPALVFGATTLGVAVAALALLTIALAAPPLPVAPVGAGTSGGPGRRLTRDLTGGAAAVLADRRLTGTFVVLAASIGLLGALSVFTVVIAIDRLGLDQAAAGYLTAANGFGALIGSSVAVVLVGRERLGPPLVGAAVCLGLAVAALGLTTEPVLVTAILVVAGMGWAFAYVAATTLTQRLAGDDVMSRVFGVSESVTTGAEALGGLAVPLLIAGLGAGGALVVAGLALPLVVLLAAPAFLRSDGSDPAFLARLRVVRAVPMLTPLAGPVLERLAADAVELSVPAGEAVVRAGEIGDRFYVVLSGVAEVEIAGQPRGRIAAGEAFGEIALLHDVPRTATVRAATDLALLAIDREPFIAALTGQARSHAVAVETARDRLAADASQAG